MTFRITPIVTLLGVVIIITGCAIATVAVPTGVGVAAKEVNKYVGSIKQKAQNLEQADDDLAPMSVKAIADGNTRKAIETYGRIYHDDTQPARIRAAALYQMGLIKMSPFNAQRDTEKAYDYFKLAHSEFPDDLEFCRNIFEHMDRLESGVVLAADYQDWTRYELRRVVVDQVKACDGTRRQGLATEAVAAIRENSSNTVTEKLQKIGASKANETEVRAAAYAQAGLVMASRFNAQRHPGKAERFFDRVKNLDESVYACFGLAEQPNVPVSNAF